MSTTIHATVLALSMLSHVHAVRVSLSSCSRSMPSWSRREMLSSVPVAAAAVAAPALFVSPTAAWAFVAGDDQETSGLVVLRIAEVCAFQEKLLRNIAICSNPKTNKETLVDQFGNPYCGGEAYSVSPGQIMFATGVMLRNSNLDGNLRLMIDQEVPKAQKEPAIKDAVAIMNSFTNLANTAGNYQVFEDKDLLLLADMYGDSRRKLAKFFNCAQNKPPGFECLHT